MGEAQLRAEPVEFGGCPCGRVHFRPQKRRGLRKPSETVGRRVSAALWADKALQDPKSGQWHVQYSGDCQTPLTVAQNDAGAIFARYYVRCRVCKACLRAKRNYWGFAAMNMTKQAEASGDRSWFGTLTMDLEHQGRMIVQARAKHGDPSAEWWADPYCDERFKLVCNEFHQEVRKYFRRLRHAGVNFKYFLVYERHKSGLPHAHFIIHEDGGRILKKMLRSHWPCGFMAASLIGGRSRNAPAPERAAWYAVKYLTKSRQARVKASPGYVPQKRPQVSQPKA